MATKPEVDSSTVAKIARLARIQVPQSQQEQAASELRGILDWVAQLDEVDTTGVEPMTSVAEIALAMRPDVVTDGNLAGDLLANATDAERGFFTVPKVVE